MLIIAEIKPKMEKYGELLLSGQLHYDDDIFIFLYETYIHRENAIIDITKEILGSEFERFEKSFFRQIYEFYFESIMSLHKEDYGSVEIINSCIDEYIKPYEKTRYFEKIKMMFDEIKLNINK